MAYQPKHEVHVLCIAPTDKHGFFSAVLVANKASYHENKYVVKKSPSTIIVFDGIVLLDTPMVRAVLNLIPPTRQYETLLQLQLKPICAQEFYNQ
jgi:hypothetical protein